MNGRGKNRGKEKNTEKGRPNGGKRLRGKTHGKRVVSTQREVPRKRKDQMGNNPRQESNKKLRVKKERRERKKVIKRGEKMRQE